MAFQNPSDSVIREILAHPRRIAVIGCSPDPRRDSHEIASRLIARGHDVVPVNPAATEILGRRCYPSLTDVPGEVDMASVFRTSEHVAGIVDEAIAKHAKVVWTQLGIGDEVAAERALRAGLVVVMNRCVEVEYHRLF